MSPDPIDLDFVFDEHAPAGGVYANDVDVWHTAHEFTADFLAHWIHPNRDHETRLVVARVRIPTSAMFGVVQKLSSGLDEYEVERGRLTPPPTEAS